MTVCVSSSEDYFLNFSERIIKLHTHKNASFIKIPAMVFFLAYFDAFAAVGSN
jgi:hypothetical protein